MSEAKVYVIHENLEWTQTFSEMVGRIRSPL